ncbi:MAG: hypothetical protein Nkreftii_001654 [Candidatus Nitrospira kreftii]|uniref:Uncharacterized protein n=1 Tax=Candidatus Nitrospira kreftii TaxID=2652173 RepID=A0A7S8FDL2_9BACT|nr:MAG: hypothetical protein Nkreftii_001654 [Candidatus Nitrospira kreftii]
MSYSSALRITTLIIALCATALPVDPSPTLAEPYFEDGFLGLSQKELHTKLGLPQAVRDRKSALRVFTYYPITDWSKYFSKLVSPENGEDVYTFLREGIDVRYSFSYAVDPNDENEDRPLIVRLVDIEFSQAVPIYRIPALVPEFQPSTDSRSPAFRSNIWLLLFKGPPSSAARFIVRENGKDQLDWSLCFQLFSMQGLPTSLTPSPSIDRMEISTQSLQLVTRRQRHTHEPISNPYADHVEHETIPAKPLPKPIPVPQYEE